jgi:CPA1 family monovalent cation:H+ antiporter
VNFLVLETAILLLLLVACLSAFIFRPLKLPYTVGLVVVGFGIGHLEGFGIPADTLSELVLSPDLILFIFIPPLIFESAINLDNRLLERNLLPILALAGPGLILSMFLIGGLVSWLTPLAVGSALLFGALVSATDPVAVIALFKEFGVAKRLTVLLEGESMLNDATAIVAFEILLFVIASAGAATLNPSDVLLRITAVLVGGLLVGLLMGILMGFALALAKTEVLIQVTVSVIVAYMTFIIAEHYLHVSGVIAVMVAGLILGRHTSRRITAAQRVFFKEFWGYTAFLANSLVFLLVGLSSADFLGGFSAFDPRDLSLAVGIAIVAALLVRAIVVFSIIPPLNRYLSDGPIDWRYRAVMSWGGLRGAIALALVLSLDQNFSDRDLLLAMTLGVVLFTILVSGGTMGAIIHRLRLDTPHLIERLMEAEALFLASQRAADTLADLEQREPFRGTVPKSTGSRFQDKLNQAETALRTTWSSLRTSSKLSRRALWTQALALEQKGYQQLFDSGVISDGILEKLQLLVDLKREAARMDHIPPPVAAHELLTAGWGGKMRSGFVERQSRGEQLLDDVMEQGLSDLVRDQRQKQALQTSYEYELAMFEVAGDVAVQIEELAKQHALEKAIAAGCVRAYQTMREQSLRRLRDAAIDEPRLVCDLQALIVRQHALSGAAKMVDQLVAQGLISREIAAKTRAELSEPWVKAE